MTREQWLHLPEVAAAIDALPDGQPVSLPSRLHKQLDEFSRFTLLRGSGTDLFGVPRPRKYRGDRLHLDGVLYRRTAERYFDDAIPVRCTIEGPTCDPVFEERGYYIFYDGYDFTQGLFIKIERNKTKTFAGKWIYAPNSGNIYRIGAKQF
jgi:hypothetical protein